MTGKRINRIPLLSSAPFVRISSSRRAYMTFAVLLTGSRSIAFGSGIQGGRGVLAIINSQFIRWCPPFGSFGLVTGAVDNDSPETLLALMLAFPAEFIVASAPPVINGNKFPLEESKFFLQLL
jgi:hypothetical protein